MANLENIGVSANGMNVLFDPLDSHAATHLEDTPQLEQLVREIFANTILAEDVEFFEYDFGETVGNSDLVENDEGDVIVYAKRKNRDVYTPFNMTQKPQPCSVVSIYAEKINHESYELKSAWIGYKDSPSFPGDEYETPESKLYWMSHSLVWGTQEIKEGTKIDECPW